MIECLKKSRRKGTWPEHVHYSLWQPHAERDELKRQAILSNLSYVVVVVPFDHCGFLGFVVSFQRCTACNLTCTGTRVNSLVGKGYIHSVCESQGEVDYDVGILNVDVVFDHVDITSEMQMENLLRNWSMDGWMENGPLFTPSFYTSGRSVLSWTRGSTFARRKD